MTIEKIINGDSAVIRPEGWLDTQTSPELGKVMDELGSDVKNIELDFAKLEYISSAGLRQVVAINKKFESLVITNVSPEIMDIFNMTGFSKRLNIK
ncbi:MAG: STAS domain-containing protein [Clostridia bacterium]|nr:STAS domain-containing protein [Clostridia bacterium]